MKRANKVKKETEEKIEITQKMWVETMTLVFDKKACISCDLCRQACPKEAISLRVEGGRALPCIDENLCSMCGMCATFCPVLAVRLTLTNSLRGTQEEVKPILDVGGVPHFSKGMNLDNSHCPDGCDLCVKACPREALSFGDSGLELDRSRCLSCAHCEDACPVPEAIHVTRLFEGQVVVDTEKCPPGCDLCVSACPTRSFKALEKGVEVDSRHCICCGACIIACPYGAIDLRRMKLRSEGDGYSAVWARALDRLLSESERFLEHNEGSFARLVDLLKSSRL